MSKTDPKNDEKKQEFFSMLDEYFEMKKEQFQEEKKSKKTESPDLLSWLMGCLAVLMVMGLPSISFAAGILPADLVWSNPVDTVNGIQVEKGSIASGPFVMLSQVPAGSTAYHDGTNGAGETACYRVAYFNTAGVGPYSPTVCKNFPLLPTAAPVGFSVR